MDTFGDRLLYARKSKGFTQESLGDSIGVSRGVIYNLEKNLTEPQTIVVNAICDKLNIQKEWLINGYGEMENIEKNNKREKSLEDLYDVAKGLSEAEQQYLLDTIPLLKKYYENKSK